MQFAVRCSEVGAGGGGRATGLAHIFRTHNGSLTVQSVAKAGLWSAGLHPHSRDNTNYIDQLRPLSLISTAASRLPSQLLSIFSPLTGRESISTAQLPLWPKASTGSITFYRLRRAQRPALKAESSWAACRPHIMALSGVAPPRSRESLPSSQLCTSSAEGRQLPPPRRRIHPLPNRLGSSLQRPIPTAAIRPSARHTRVVG